MKDRRLANVFGTMGLALAASAEALTWNGGNGGAWDATTANWTTAGGAATAWVDGSDIVVPAGQTVNATDVFRVSGATLGAGAGIGGSGALLLDGPVDVASGAAAANLVANGSFEESATAMVAAGSRSAKA